MDRLLFDRRQTLISLGVAALPAVGTPARAAGPATLQAWPLRTPQRTGIHDVAPAPDGGVWFSAQRSGHLGWFDPKSGKTELIALGSGSSPHGVIQGPDKAAWLTDGGQQAIARVSWPERQVRLFKLPEGTPAMPDSKGMVSATRSSKAPAMNAPLPEREQPCTPMALGLINCTSDCSSTSMMRLTPHAQAASMPVSGWSGFTV